jgi:hypothetical protein
MIFRNELALKVMSGSKTVTRRTCSRNPRSPWYIKRCGLRAGSTYAVCTGRGQPAIGRILILRVRREPLGFLDDAEAQLEGFESAEAFRETWKTLHKRYDSHARVWRVEFETVTP